MEVITRDGKVTWILLTWVFFCTHLGIATLYLTTFPSTGYRLLVWRLFWLAPIPFSSHLLLELKSMFQPFHPLCRLPQPGQSLSGTTRLTFPSSCGTYGWLHNWLAPLGMDNPRLKPPDSVINDMSSGCDPCSLAVMPHVEPRELCSADKGDLYNYALAQQSSPLANIDRAWQDLY